MLNIERQRRNTHCAAGVSCAEELAKISGRYIGSSITKIKNVQYEISAPISFLRKHVNVLKVLSEKEK